MIPHPLYCIESSDLNSKGILSHSPTKVDTLSSSLTDNWYSDKSEPLLFTLLEVEREKQYTNHTFPLGTKVA